MDYIVTFIAVAAIPLALAAYGGHLAAKLLDGRNRSRALAIVWSLAGAGVLFSGLQQYRSFRSDSKRDERQAALQRSADQLRERLDASLQRQEYIRGQLESVELVLSKVAEGNSNASVLKQLASAIGKMGYPRQRQLSEDQKNSIQAAMQEFKSQSFVVYCPDDKETAFFAADISSALKRAGWSFVPTGIVSYDPPWRGVELCKGPPAATKLSDLLGSMGIEMATGHCGKEENLNTKDVVIEVGYGPE